LKWRTNGEPTKREIIAFSVLTTLLGTLLASAVQYRWLPEGLYDRQEAAYALRNALSGLALDVRLMFVAGGIAVGILISVFGLALTATIFRRNAHRIGFSVILCLTLWFFSALLLVFAVPFYLDLQFESWAATRCFVEDVTRDFAAPLWPELAKFERALRD
jgi:hypothetical protein